MSWKHVLSFGFFLTVLVLLLFYWILPVGNIVNFGYSTVGENSNFSLINGTGMQFYDNMRYADEEISYHIEDCPIPKVDEITRAFEVIQNLTMLSFMKSLWGRRR